MTQTTTVSRAAPYPTKPRRNYPRSKTGCLTCRRRKKKCDEGRPRCKGCRRNDLECSWPASQRRAATDGEPVQSGESEVPDQCNSDQHTSSSSLVNGENRSQSPGCCGVSPLSSLGSFMSPIRPTLLTPRSGVFLQHYQLKTARLIVPAPDRRNPFLQSVLPLAQVDDLLMHCVMALGGAHLGSKVINMSAEIQTATMHHYFHVLRSLRKNIDNALSWSTTETLRTLLALIMISLFEALSTTSLDGAMFHHLRASRQLILHLMNGSQPTSNDDKHLFGFALEGYVYLVLVNVIGPNGMMGSRTIPHDSFMDSLATLSEYDTFGIFLAGCHELFAIIPRVAALAGDRIREASEGKISHNSKSTYKNLLAEVRSWEPTDPPTLDSQETAHRKAVGRVYQHALMIYLKAAVAGFDVEKPGFLSIIEAHIQSIIQLVLGECLDTTMYANILLWPLIMVGSCLINQTTRDYFVSQLGSHQSGTWTSLRAIELLQLMWSEHDHDNRFFGPLGLYLTMQKHGINFCMA